MRPTVKNAIVASLAALTLGLAVVSATPASANPWPHPGFHHGYWGPGLALGVVGLAAGAAYAASQDDCVEYRPIYDRWGRYLGRRAIDVCQ